MRIAFLDVVHPVLPEKLAAAGHEVLLDRALPIVDEQVEGLVVRNSIVSAYMIEALPHLRFIGRVGSGLENIDRKACERLGINVFNSPEGNRDGVGEMALALLLALLKHVVRGDKEVRSGIWSRESNRGLEVGSRTIGIIGFGNTGSAFAQKLIGFNARILAYDKFQKNYAPAHVEETTMEVLKRQCDVISVHVPLDENTRYLVDAEFIQSVERPFYLLNTSRGGVVQLGAVLAALRSGQMLGAGLDVLEHEAADLSHVSDDTQGVLKALREEERVVFTPHVAGVTHEGKFRMADILADKLLRAIADEQL